MSSMKRITVLLADDNRGLRKGFRKILEHEGDLEVVGEAKNGLQAVAMVKNLCPALVLMDIAMPLLNGLHATRPILKAVPATKVLILSAHSEDVYVEEASRHAARDLLHMSDITRILNSIEQGDPRAADELLPLIYAELRRLAAAKMAREQPGHTLQATALVHGQRT